MSAHSQSLIVLHQVWIITIVVIFVRFLLALPFCTLVRIISHLLLQMVTFYKSISRGRLKSCEL